MKFNVKNLNLIEFLLLLQAEKCLTIMEKEVLYALGVLKKKKKQKLHSKEKIAVDLDLAHLQETKFQKGVHLHLRKNLNQW